MRLSILLSMSILLAGCKQTAEEPVSATAQGTDQAAMDQPLADQPAEAIPPATAPAAGPARFDGYAGLRFGMDETEARSAWVGVLEGESGDDCHYLRPEGDAPSRSPALMFEDGRFVRYDVQVTDMLAPGGGRVGMDAAAIGELYGDRVVAGPHKYSDGQYLRIEDTDGDGVLVFETAPDGRVTEWRVGLVPQVDYVEGCS